MEPRCHGLRLFGNLGVYQGIVSYFGFLCLGGWEQETGCTLLILMLVVSFFRIMREAIVTSSLLAVGHPSCGQKWNPGFGSIGLWPPLVMLFKALISGAEMLLPGWKGSPSVLLSTWYGKKGIEEFLKTPTHWLNLFFRDFMFYSTWYCTFKSAIISNFCELTILVVVLDVLSCRMLSSLRFAVHIVYTSKLIVLVIAASLEVLMCCMMLMFVTSYNLWCPRHLLYVSYFS